MCLKIAPLSPKESFEKGTVQKMNIYQILLSQDTFPPSVTNHSFFMSSFIIICKWNTHRKQQGPLKIAAELWLKSSWLGHPGREVRLATDSGSLLLSMALETCCALSWMWEVCGEHIVQIISGLWAGLSLHFLLHVRGIFPFCPWTFSLPFYHRHLFHATIIFLSCSSVQPRDAQLLVVNSECTTSCSFIYRSFNKYLALIFFLCVST